MVTKLCGKVNGEAVIFENKGDNRWSVDVPNMPNGKYVIELTAYDDAGNSTYTTAILFTVDTSGIRIEWLYSDYYCELLDGVYNLKLIKGKEVNLLEPEYSVMVVSDNG